MTALMPWERFDSYPSNDPTSYDAPQTLPAIQVVGTVSPPYTPNVVAPKIEIVGTKSAPMAQDQKVPMWVWGLLGLGLVFILGKRR